MSPRQRLVAAASRDAVDRLPVVVWSASPGHRCDALACPLSELGQARDTHPDQAVLVEVLSPFGRALSQELDLCDLLASVPAQGGRVLGALKTEARREIDAALRGGADGVLYLIEGAYPSACTPMEYGGFFLEVDRELLEHAKPALCNIAYIEGEGDIYYDFVSDLPCHFLAWDYPTNQVTIAQAKKMRSGAIAVDHEGADAIFARSSDSADGWLDRLAAASNFA